MLNHKWLRAHNAARTLSVAAIGVAAISAAVLQGAGAGAAQQPNDPGYTLGNQWALTKLRAPEAWDITTGSPGVTVALVDTGADLDHADLAAKLLPGHNTVSAGATAQDDFAGPGHGSLAAGVVGASTNNAVGVAGIAWNARLLPVKVCDSAYCALTDTAEGIRWAADQGADVINVFPGFDSDPNGELLSAVNHAAAQGAIVVAAVGNSSASIQYPARYPGVIAVGVTDQNDAVTTYSPAGADLDLVAPGVSITSTTKMGNYTTFTGAGASAPHVSGVLALLLSQGISDTAAVQALFAGAKDLGAAGWDANSGWGRVDACGALSAAGFPCPVVVGTATPTRTNTPAPATATSVPPTATRTNTPVPTATRTNTPAPPTATSVPPTATWTNTPLPPTATRTNTPVPPATATPVPPTATRTNTPLPPTATWTPTPTPAVPTPTMTATAVPPTATRTATVVPPTSTRTNTPVPPTATWTASPSPTPTKTVCPAGKSKRRRC